MARENSPSRRDVLKAGAAAAGLAAWGSFPAAAADATEIDGGTSITEPGNYVLTEDIDVSRGPAAIDVSASNVTIDGQGHTVSNDAGECISIFVGADNVTVKNTRVSGDRNGFLVAGNDATLFNNLVSGNGRSGILLSAGKRTKIEACVVRENSLIGISGSDTEDRGSADETTVFTSVVADNGLEGILLRRTDDAAVERCLVSGNGTDDATRGHGIGLIDRTRDLRLANNQLLSNVADGVSFRTRDAERTLFGLNAVGNAVANNGSAGFGFRDLVNADVEQNVFARNGRGVEGRFDRSHIRGNQFVDNDFSGACVHSLVRENGFVGDGVALNAFAHSEFLENTIIGSSQHGFSTAFVEESTFSSNTIVGSMGDGVWTDEFFGNDVRWNNLSGNSGNGFTTEQGVGSTFKFNAVTGNGGDGLSLSGFDNDDPGTYLVRKNTTSANGGAGILLIDTVDSQVTRNRVCANAGGSIETQGLADNVIENNQIC
ncbi:hypothetical protein C499_17969 [Halogeometricum borinquense DSM 11551]|uniref:Right handed beta helix domain-containing protein n=1 Tax=Halogeometricum borinquense (strain ATCC 700274 / DSM 11551 / JCM 10706 / KCTC 4070 / PR3) TaxID=469382 RepID=E4NPI6_HALBP|nr:right-handed parallel beta-helix repeat-containing protein [Halogeometricum borinquense]ADQ67656.1 hypothetical protein Hbor_20910 [Halogeometricum borinquense DSM 11551]ELY23663.1 hypothetical protein C499_17969 [Halogeometricum borinquense DSM 11551]